MRNRGLIVVAVLAFLVYGMSAAVLGTLLPEFPARFGFNEGQNGTAALVRAAGLMAASLAAGPLIDLRGKKFGVMLGFSVLTAGLVLLALSAGFASVGAAMLLIGLGGGTVVTAVNALVSDIGTAGRASLLTLLNLFFGVGGLLTPLLASIFFTGRAFALTWLVAILGAATFLLYAATPMPPPDRAARVGFSQTWKLLGQPRLLQFSALLFLYVACEGCVWDWLAQYLVSRGIPGRVALRIVSLGFALGMLSGRAVASRILLRVPPAVLMPGCAALIALTTFCLLHSTGAWLAGVLVFCAGAAMAPIFPSTLSMIGDAYPVGGATAMGIAITCGWTGLAIVSKIVGAGAEASGLGTALLVLPVLGVLMLAMSLTLPGGLIRPRGRGEPEEWSRT